MWYARKTCALDVYARATETRTAEESILVVSARGNTQLAYMKRDIPPEDHS
jgi:hypothetical protein